MSSFVERARSGLETLRALDANLTVFGAKTHRYELLRTVPARVVEEIEREHGFRFPDDYRRFVMELGGGGAGPSYGLRPFGTVDDGFGYARWTSWKLRPGEPFPHRDAWNDVAILELGAPSPDDFEDEHAYRDAHDAWRDSDAAQAQQNAYWEAVGTRRGCIPICHHGCALRDWLVVSGPQAGEVWHDASADQAGIAPEIGPDGARLTFSGWYVRWIESSLATLRAR